MKKNLYNSNDEKYKRVINLLNDLPKVKTDANFEYNLKVRIENKNFNIREEKVGFSLWKIFIPAGTVAAAFLVFSLYSFNSNENFENPFKMQPQLRSEMMGNFTSTTSKAIKGEISNNDVIIKQNSADEIVSVLPKAENKLRFNSKNNNVEFPFKNYKSTDIDEVLNNNNVLPSQNGRATLVGGNNSSLFFDGFYIREEVDKKYVEAMKARLDSLKREMQNQN
ncbi:MAG: hypothetical protein KDC67_04485 [Ignavibacteriae bacterium]|nr:hypothetical protein [Ignavibacteriota bacterium]MCB0747304.1 hypothetical protein [Ignavibacteriota bacterium]